MCAGVRETAAAQVLAAARALALLAIDYCSAPAGQ